MHPCAFRRRTTAAPIALGAIAAFAACGPSPNSSTATSPSTTSPSSSTTSQSSSSSVSGTPFSSGDFSTVIPDGWKDTNPTLCTGSQALLCIFTTASGGGAAVALISVDTFQQPVADSDLASTLQKLVSDQGAQGLQTGSAQVGGGAAPSVTYSTSASGSAADMDADIAINHNGKTYRIHYQVESGGGRTLQSYGSDFDDVLAAWQWS